MDLFAGAGFAGATRESCVFPASDLLFRRCRGEKPVYTGEGAHATRENRNSGTPRGRFRSGERRAGVAVAMSGLQGSGCPDVSSRRAGSHSRGAINLPSIFSMADSAGKYERLAEFISRME